MVRTSSMMSSSRPRPSSSSSLARTRRSSVSVLLSWGARRFRPLVLGSRTRELYSSSPENCFNGCGSESAPSPIPTEPIPWSKTQKAALCFASVGILFCCFCFEATAMFCRYSLFHCARSLLRSPIWVSAIIVLIFFRICCIRISRGSEALSSSLITSELGDFGLVLLSPCFPSSSSMATASISSSTGIGWIR